MEKQAACTRRASSSGIPQHFWQNRDFAISCCSQKRESFRMRGWSTFGAFAGNTTKTRGATFSGSSLRREEQRYLLQSGMASPIKTFLIELCKRQFLPREVTQQEVETASWTALLNQDPDST
jgi:hypothetical protein